MDGLGAAESLSWRAGCVALGRRGLSTINTGTLQVSVAIVQERGGVCVGVQTLKRGVHIIHQGLEVHIIIWRERGRELRTHRLLCCEWPENACLVSAFSALPRMILRNCRSAEKVPECLLPSSLLRK